MLSPWLFSGRSQMNPSFCLLVGSSWHVTATLSALGNLERFVVLEATYLDNGGDAGESVETHPSSLAHDCCVDLGRPVESPRLEVWCLGNGGDTGGAVEPYSLYLERDCRDDPSCPVGSWWRDTVEVAGRSVEFHSLCLKLVRPVAEAGQKQSLLLWRRGE